MPSFGLDMSRKTTATELANLFKVLPVALLVVPALFTTFGEVMEGEASCRHFHYILMDALAYMTDTVQFCCLMCYPTWLVMQSC